MEELSNSGEISITATAFVHPVPSGGYQPGVETSIGERKTRQVYVMTFETPEMAMVMARTLRDEVMASLKFGFEDFLENHTRAE